MTLTVLRRAEVGWLAERLQGPTDVLRLPTIGVELPLERIYERTAVASRARGLPSSAHQEPSSSDPAEP